MLNFISFAFIVQLAITIELIRDLFSAHRAEVNHVLLPTRWQLLVQTMGAKVLNWGPIIAVGHSHGGTLIEHASRSLPGSVPLVPILLATPSLHYDEKLADRSHAHISRRCCTPAMSSFPDWR